MFDDIKIAYEILKDARNGIIKSDILKRFAREDTRRGKDPIGLSLMEEWRTHWDEDTRVEYVIFEDSGESDELIQSVVNDMRVDLYTPYDCSGAWFTTSIRWFRCGAGIAVIHRLALDV